MSGKSSSETDRSDALVLLLTPRNRGEAFLMGMAAGWLLLILAFYLGQAIPEWVFEVLFP